MFTLENILQDEVEGAARRQLEDLLADDARGRPSRRTTPDVLVAVAKG